MLKKHNELRKRHECKELKLNKDLNLKAQKFADNLATSSNPIFINDLYKGEVLGTNILIYDAMLEPENICDEWYKESDNYNYKLNKFQKGTGHFTQMIWKDTKMVGFGMRKKDNTNYVVAYYYPAGNIFNEFISNVNFPKEKGKKIKIEFL